MRKAKKSKASAAVAAANIPNASRKKMLHANAGKKKGKRGAY